MNPPHDYTLHYSQVRDQILCVSLSMGGDSTSTRIWEAPEPRGQVGLFTKLAGKRCRQK
jgi:hypothetical protein